MDLMAEAVPFADKHDFPDRALHVLLLHHAKLDLFTTNIDGPFVACFFEISSVHDISMGISGGI